MPQPQIPTSKSHKYVSDLLFPLILLLYPMRHITMGVEWWDTAYNYGNFVYIENMDPMWLFSTYFANILGNLFTRFPFGNYMLGMNVYTGLFISILAVLAYYFFTKQIKLPSVFAFIGEFIAINLCWCPTAVLYNYLTFFLLAIAVVCLYYALMYNQNKFFVIAGLFLGFNVFVRFPNLAQMALILAVWAMGIIDKKNWKQIFIQTGYCFLGYMIAIGSSLFFFHLQYGMDEYVASLQRLFTMSSEASEYTIYSMILSQIHNYQQNLIWLSYLAFFTVLGIIGFCVLPKRFILLKKIGYVMCVFCGFYKLMMLDMFNVTYNTQMSMFQWAVILLTATIIGNIIIIFRSASTRQEKLMAGLSILVILITPLGSNTHLYASINNLFFIVPFTVWNCYRALKQLPKVWNYRKMEVYTFPIKAMCYSIFFMILVQSTGFGICYVFSEASGGKNLNTKIENNDILRGMVTSPDREQVLSSVSKYVVDAGLKGREVLLYGYIPSMSYYLEMPFLFTPWPDLASYNYDVMKSDMEQLEQDITSGISDFPVLLLEKKTGSYLAYGQEGLDNMTLTENEIETIVNDKKLELICNFAEKYEYELSFENSKFILLQSRKDI